jgi:hypothetical protein
MKLLQMCFVMSVGLLWADDRNVDFDRDADFTKYRTYALRGGRNTTKSPDLNSPIVNKRIEEALRTQFAAKGMEEGQRPDLLVTWRFGSANKRQVQSWPAGRRGWGRTYSSYTFTEGTLVVDLTDRETKELVWRGIYRDDESNAKNIAKKIDNDVKELFEKYPPKK